MEDRKELEMEEVVCPSCDGNWKDFSPRKYFKTAKELGEVHCEWCMDTGKTRQLKLN